MWAAWSAVPDLQRRTNQLMLMLDFDYFVFYNFNVIEIQRLPRCRFFWAMTNVYIINCIPLRHFAKVAALSQNSSDASIPQGSFSLTHTHRNRDKRTFRAQNFSPFYCSTSFLLQGRAMTECVESEVYRREKVWKGKNTSSSIQASPSSAADHFFGNLYINMCPA